MGIINIILEGYDHAMAYHFTRSRELAASPAMVVAAWGCLLSVTISLFYQIPIFAPIISGLSTGFAECWSEDSAIYLIRRIFPDDARKRYQVIQGRNAPD